MRLFVVFTFLLSFESISYATSLLPLPKPFSAYSLDQTMRVEVMPGDFQGTKPVKAAIYKKGASDWTQIRTIALVNKICPNEVFVSSSGSVATVDEWYSEGHQHSVVIYDVNGKLAADHSLEDILTSQEIEAHVKKEANTTARRVWLIGPGWAYWGKRPKFQFLDNAFLIVTGWGKQLEFDLTTGDLT